MTDEQKQNYLDCGGVFCPFCQSHDIEGQSIDVEEGLATQEMHCNECEEDWTDVYKLSSVRVVS